jgi:hypothetical protein
MMFLLLNVDLTMIVDVFEQRNDANAALELANFDGHVVDSEKFAGVHTLKELTEYYSNLPYSEQHPVERFPNRAAAIRSINEAIQREGVTVMAKRKSRKAKKTTNGAPLRGRTRSWTKVEITAAGKSDDVRFQQGQPRFKVYEYIKKHGEITAETLFKFGESIGLSQAQLMGAISKLVFRKLVRTV